MRYRIITLAATAILLAATGTAIADHNSQNGEGTANMPNDIHNTRVETLETDDNEAFRDFVRYGDGSDSANRFDSDDTQPNRAVEREGNANSAANQGENPTRMRNEVETKAATQEQTRTETRSRHESDVSATSRANLGATTRDRGNNRAGGRRGG